MEKRKALMEKKEALKATKEQMGVFVGYKEPSVQESQFKTLINNFHMADNLEEKLSIASEIEALKGELPIDLQMEIDMLRNGPKR